MSELTPSDYLGIVGLIVAIGVFFLGFFFGKRNSDKQLELFVKALNIERIIKDGKDPELFIEDGTVKGKMTVTAGLSIKANLIDLKNKKIITEKGSRDMTKAEIEKYGKKSPV